MSNATWRIRHVASNRVLATIVLLPGVPALFVLNYVTFFPIYARDILDIGAAGYGLLTGAIGVGAVIGAMSIAKFRPSGGSGRLVVGGLARAAERAGAAAAKPRARHRCGARGRPRRAHRPPRG